MALFWKLLVVALLTMPMGAYVTGSLVGSRTELPRERPAVVLEDAGLSEPGQTLTGKPRPEGSRSPQPSAAARGRGDHESGDASGDEVRTIGPEPDDLDDREGGHDDRDDPDDDTGGRDDEDDDAVQPGDEDGGVGDHDSVSSGSDDEADESDEPDGGDDSSEDDGD